MRSEAKTNIVTSGAMSGNVTSSSVDVSRVDLCAIQAVYVDNGSAPNGTLYLEASNDGTTFSRISASDVAITAAGDTLWNLSDVGYHYVRLKFTFSSGNGTLNATAYVKERS